jgi:hypothetical protein
LYAPLRLPLSSALKGKDMKASLLPFIVCFLVVASLAGCTTRLVDFTVISSKNINMKHSQNFVEQSQRIVGTDMKPVIIFPLGIPSAKAALDDAIDSVPGCVALENGVLEQRFFVFIFGFVEFRATGNCLIDTTKVN